MEQKILDSSKDSIYTNNINVLNKLPMKNWTSVRAVYLLMSLVLFIGLALHNWYVIAFVIAMLNVGVWTKFCPSKWVFEKLGLKKTEL